MTATLHKLRGGRDAGLYYTNDPNREARPNSRDEYYVRDGGGVWWSSGETIVKHDAEIDAQTFRDLCGGFDPMTGKPLVRGAGEGHRAGWDITFSAPKSLSVLWMAGDERQRAMLHDMHRAAVNDALKFLVDERLVEVRRGAGGHIREAPADVIVARFDHFTSRAGDGNVHTHAVLLNISCSKKFNHKNDDVKINRKFLTLEPRKLFDMQKVVGRAYAASLAQRLAKKGLSPRSAGRDQFEIAGIPDDELLQKFSKRSRQIEKRVGRDATAAQKELAALATRSSKDEVPVGEALERRWQDELAEIGIDPWKAAREFAPGREVNNIIQLDFDPPEIEGAGPVAVAASKLFRHQSVISRKDLLYNALVEATLGAVGIDQVRAEIELFEKRGVLLRLEGEERGESWTTRSIADVEASLLRAANRPDERDWFRSEAVEAAIANAPLLSAEQAQAIRVASSRDGVSICEAAAGTGKTFLARTIIDAVRRSDLATDCLDLAADRSGLKTNVIGLSPTWVGADELSKSCGIEAHAIAKWRHDYLVGRIPKIGSNVIFIIDEIGVAGIKDLEFIARIAQEAHAHAKIICFGDRRQLESPQNGNVLRALVDVVARGSVLSQIRRQEVSWQSAASMVMAQGDSEAGLRAYAKNNRLELVSGEAAAQARVIQVWNEYRRQHGDDVLIVTRRNSDAAALNRAARDVLREQGRLRGPDRPLTAVGRDGKISAIELALGDRIRFGENLPKLGIRNGTRGTVERITTTRSEPKIAFRLEDGRLVEEGWAALIREQRGRAPDPPRISHAYAGTAYSVQGRTSAAAVLYVGKATDARTTYVGLTRHRLDACVVAEFARPSAAVQQRQSDARANPSTTAVLEQLFAEARSYSEKANVVDYVADRISFIRTGQVVIERESRSFNLGRVAQAAQRMFEASWAADRTLSLPCWRLIKSVRLIHRHVSERVAAVISSVRARIVSRTNDYAVTREWDISR